MQEKTDQSLESANNEMNQEQSEMQSVESQADQKDAALEKCEQDVQMWQDKCLRVAADFENFKKRTEKERSQLQYMLQSNMILDVLHIIDNVDRAFQELEDKEVSDEFKNWVTGFKLIDKDLKKFLEKHGVTKITEFDEFDPQLHEAMMHVSDDDHEAGQIVQVLQEGYKLQDQVLRPAKVSVAK